MQAIIMAAGRGSRLGNFTNNKPKCFLDIKGHRIIDYNIAMLHRFGIWDITIVTGYQDSEFQKTFRDVPGIALVYNPFYELTNVIGSYFLGMGRLCDDVVYMHADTLCDVEIFEDMFKKDGDIVLPVDVKHVDDEAMKVRLCNGKVKEITKDMKNEDAFGEFIGICKIKREALYAVNDAAVELLRDKQFESYFEGALQKVINKEKFEFTVFDTSGRFWSEVDFKEDYENAVHDISKSLLALF